MPRVSDFMAHGIKSAKLPRGRNDAMQSFTLLFTDSNGYKLCFCFLFPSYV